MSVKLNDRYLKNFITARESEAAGKEAEAALQTVRKGCGAGNDFLGWRYLPEIPDKEEYARIKKAAEQIRRDCRVLLVIGIGGSYLGARAAIEYLLGQNYNRDAEDRPEIIFVGKDLSAATICETLSRIEGKEVCLNVISKSGTTTEPAVAFRIFREWMEKKYGDSAAKRIYVTTDKARGKLKELSDRRRARRRRRTLLGSDARGTSADRLRGRRYRRAAARRCRREEPVYERAL